MDNLVAGDLRLEAVDGGPGNPIAVHVTGKSNDRFPGKVLAPYFSSLLTRAAAAPRPLDVHFEALEHMNSSTVTSIIQLIQDARGRNVPLTLIYDQRQRWQKLSFEALRVFVKNDDLFRLRST